MIRLDSRLSRLERMKIPVPVYEPGHTIYLVRDDGPDATEPLTPEMEAAINEHITAMAEEARSIGYRTPYTAVVRVADGTFRLNPPPWRRGAHHAS